jgi:hypothetical protein
MRIAVSACLGVLVSLFLPGCGTTVAAPVDSSAPPDAASTTDAATATDAATVPDAAATPDAAAASDTGMTCDPSVVTFNAGGSLEVGQLCDDVFACVATAADASALEAAAPDFDCSVTPMGSCGGVTCQFSPSTLDASELAEICTMTVLSPQPSLVCMIYL